MRAQFRCSIYRIVLQMILILCLDNSNSILKSLVELISSASTHQQQQQHCIANKQIAIETGNPFERSFREANFQDQHHQQQQSKYQANQDKRITSFRLVSASERTRLKSVYLAPSYKHQAYQSSNKPTITSKHRYTRNSNSIQDSSPIRSIHVAESGSTRSRPDLATTTKLNPTWILRTPQTNQTTQPNNNANPTLVANESSSIMNADYEGYTNNEDDPYNDASVPSYIMPNVAKPKTTTSTATSTTKSIQTKLPNQFSQAADETNSKNSYAPDHIDTSDTTNFSKLSLENQHYNINQNEAANDASILPIDKQWKFAEFILIIVISAILNLVTIIGNIMVLISFKMDRSLQTVSNYFLLSLALADLLIGLISMPLYTLYLLLNYWPLGPLMCDIWLAIDYLNSNAAVLNMLIISFDRYFSVTRPLTYRAKRTTKHACLMISCAWILSLTIWTPAIFTYPYFKGRTVQGTDKCEIEFVKANTYLTFVTAILAFYIPVIIMIYLYWRIWLETKKRYRDLTTLFLVSGVGAAGPANRANRPPPILMPTRTLTTTKSTTVNNITNHQQKLASSKPTSVMSALSSHSALNRSPQAIDQKSYQYSEAASSLAPNVKEPSAKDFQQKSASSCLFDKPNVDSRKQEKINETTQNDREIRAQSSKPNDSQISSDAIRIHPSTKPAYLAGQSHKASDDALSKSSLELTLKADAYLKEFVENDSTRPAHLTAHIGSFSLADQMNPLKLPQNDATYDLKGIQVSRSKSDSMQINGTPAKLSKCSCCSRIISKPSKVKKAHKSNQNSYDTGDARPLVSCNRNKCRQNFRSTHNNNCKECLQLQNQKHEQSQLAPMGAAQSLSLGSSARILPEKATVERNEQSKSDRHHHHIQHHSCSHHHSHHHRHHHGHHHSKSSQCLKLNAKQQMHSHQRHHHNHLSHHHQHHHHDKLKSSCVIVDTTQKIVDDRDRSNSGKSNKNNSATELNQTKLSMLASSCQALMGASSSSNKSLSCTKTMHKVHPKSSQNITVSTDDMKPATQEQSDDGSASNTSIISKPGTIDRGSLSISLNPLPDKSHHETVSSISNIHQPSTPSPKADSYSDRDYETRIVSSENKFIFETNDPNLSPSLSNVVHPASSNRCQTDRGATVNNDARSSIIRNARKARGLLDTNCRHCVKLSHTTARPCSHRSCSMLSGPKYKSSCNYKALITRDEMGCSSSSGCCCCCCCYYYYYDTNNSNNSNLGLSREDQSHPSCRKCCKFAANKRNPNHHSSDNTNSNKIEVGEPSSISKSMPSTKSDGSIVGSNADIGIKRKLDQQTNTAHHKTVPILDALTFNHESSHESTTRAEPSGSCAGLIGSLEGGHNVISNATNRDNDNLTTIWHSAVSTETKGPQRATIVKSSSLSLKTATLGLNNDNAPTKLKKLSQKLTFSDILVQQSVLAPEHTSTSPSSSGSSSSTLSALSSKPDRRIKQNQLARRHKHQASRHGKAGKNKFHDNKKNQSCGSSSQQTETHNGKSDALLTGKHPTPSGGSKSHHQHQSRFTWLEHLFWPMNSLSNQDTSNRPTIHTTSPSDNKQQSSLSNFGCQEQASPMEQQQQYPAPRAAMLSLRQSINDWWNNCSANISQPRFKRSGSSSNDSSSQKNTSLSNDDERIVAASDSYGHNSRQQYENSASKPSYSTSHHPIQPKSERKAAKTLSTLLLVFIVTWLPYNVLVLIKTLSGGEDQVPEKIWNFSYYLCYINSTINPLCYALCNAQFRRTYMRILKCRLSTEHNSTRRLVPLQSSTTWSKDLRIVPDHGQAQLSSGQTPTGSARYYPHESHRSRQDRRLRSKETS